MGSEWRVSQLKDVCSKIGSGATPRGGNSVYLDGAEFALIRSQNVRNDSFDHNGLAFIEKHHADKLSNVAVEDKDVLLNITGDSVARCCQVDPTVLPARVNQHVAIIRPKSEILDPLYLRYYFVSPLMQNEMLSLAGVGATRNALTKGMIEGFEIPLPPLPEQKAIAHILGSLDDKIELNRRMNATLEGMAQALFKSWFVDFDPVIDNILVKNMERGASLEPSPNLSQGERNAANNSSSSPSGRSGDEGSIFDGIPDEIAPRAEVRRSALRANAECGIQNAEIHNSSLSPHHSLFPAAFQETESMGWIPDGWEIDCFGGVSTCFDRKRIPLSKKQREEKKPGQIPYYGATSIMDFIDEWIFDDTYLLIGEDGSVIKEDGSPFVQYIWGKAWVNNHAHVLQGKAGISTEHLMLFMQSQNIAAYVTGAVQLKINQGNMNSIPFLNAGNHVNQQFAECITPFYERIKLLTEKSETLTKLRDTLLPKLISGELRIPEAEQLTEEALS
jgi:type I restriction enzyme S subunit